MFIAKYFKKPITIKRIVNFIFFRLNIITTKFITIVVTPLDLIVPKRGDYWIFPVYFIGKGNFTDNNLAIFEQVKHDSKIKKIILTREINISVEGNNVVILPMHSIHAVWYLMCSKIIFVQHSLWLDLSKARYQIYFPFKRNIINLWHGLPIKDISHHNTGIINKRSLFEMPKYQVITSSEIDKKNMQKAFFKTNENHFWITGLPRNDFLLMEENQLPEPYLSDLKNLRKLLKHKELILYAPTYRETDVNGSYYDFSEQELDLLESYLVHNQCILGLRYHIYRTPDYQSKILQRKNIIDLSADVISDVRLIIREANLVITDYSSLYVDALYIGKRCLSFAYDYEHYLETQRGFFYDFKTIFPGEICQSFSELLYALADQSQSTYLEREVKIKMIQTILFQYIDNKNSQRVVEKVKELN